MEFNPKNGFCVITQEPNPNRKPSIHELNCMITVHIIPTVHIKSNSFTHQNNNTTKTKHDKATRQFKTLGY